MSGVADRLILQCPKCATRQLAYRDPVRDNRAEGAVKIRCLSCDEVIGFAIETLKRPRRP